MHTFFQWCQIQAKWAKFRYIILTLFIILSFRLDTQHIFSHSLKALLNCEKNHDHEQAFSVFITSDAIGKMQSKNQTIYDSLNYQANVD